MMRVVVIGGLGNFGARICRRPAGDPKFNVIATSRRGGAAARYAITSNVTNR